MKAAVISERKTSPVVDDFREPPSAAGKAVVEVAYAGLNPVDLAAARGAQRPAASYVAGREGIGHDADGRRVYFDQTVAPFGSLAERTLVDPENLIPLPGYVHSCTAIALGIAGTAAWIGLDTRARLRQGERVLILGAGGAVGQIAIQAARILHASAITAVSRQPDGSALKLGASEEVALGDGCEFADAIEPDSFDVVLDMLWGEAAARSLDLLRPHGRLVQIGSSLGGTAALSPHPLRRKQLTLIGHANFMTPRTERRTAFLRLLEYAGAGEIKVRTERLPLADVAEAWDRQERGPGRKLVLEP